MNLLRVALCFLTQVGCAAFSLVIIIIIVLEHLAGEFPTHEYLRAVHLLLLNWSE